MASESIGLDGGGWSGASAGGSSSSKNSSSSGGNIQVQLHLRQTKSSSTGKVKIQVRTSFYYAPYGSYPWATLKIYSGSNSSGTKLLDAAWQWTRDPVGYHTVYSEWFTLPEQSNTTTIKLYALCRPAESYPEVGYELSISGIKRAYTLTMQPDSNVASYSYTINDASGINGGQRTNQTSITAIVYDTDKITWTAKAKTGYKLNSASGTKTVSGSNVLISITSKAMATIRIMKAGAWQLYSIYVRRGGAWVQHQANIRKAGSWQQYS